MNSNRSHGRTLSASLALAAALLVAPTAGAATILVTNSVSGPITVGQQFDVTLAVSGWDSNDGEVDGISFRVAWDPTLFSFVSDSPDSSATAFIRQSTQGAGFAFSDDTDEFAVSLGLYLFGVSDSGDATAGSVGGDAAGGIGGGLLGTFTLEAVQVGTGSIVASTNNVDDVFADKGLNGILESNITGGISFGSSSMQVIPEPSTSLLAVFGVGIALAVRRRRIA